MTENEVIEMLKAKLTCMELELLSCIGKGCDKNCENCEYNYTQGNMGEQKEALAVAIQALEEIQLYRAIGTVDECRSAVERMKPRKADLFGDGYADGHLVYDTYECPNCGEQYEVDYEEYEHCPNCGQAMEIDTSE